MAAAEGVSIVRPMTSPDYSGGGTLVLTDLSAIPDEPPDDLLYTHKVRFIDSARYLWAHREIIYTLAERDFRSQYKQATLGVTWALITPVAHPGDLHGRVLEGEELSAARAFPTRCSPSSASCAGASSRPPSATAATRS